MTVMLELHDKDFKAAMIRMFQWTTMNTLEWKEKDIKSQENKSLGKETEGKKKNQMKIWELKLE